MDSTDDKMATVIQDPTTTLDNESSDDQHVDADRPAGWKYKQIKLFGFVMPWYASPKVQLGLVAVVCFLTVGMFNAVSGMGGGGKVDSTTADEMVRSLNVLGDNRRSTDRTCRTPPYTLHLVSSVSLAGVS